MYLIVKVVKKPFKNRGCIVLDKDNKITHLNYEIKGFLLTI